MKPHSSIAKNLWVRVKNFGPLEQAEVELRPLTIFLGPSNAGKSYLATLVHTLHRFFSRHVPVEHEYGDDLLQDTEARGAGPNRRRGYHALSKQDRRTFEHWLSQMSDSEAPAATASDLWRGMDSIVRSSWENDCADVGRLNVLLRRDFGVDSTEDLIRSGSKGGAQVSVFRKGSSNRATAKYSVAPSRAIRAAELSVSPKFSFLPPSEELTPYANFIGDLQLPSGDGDDERELRIAYNRLLSIASNPFDLLKQQSHYLPADRSGMMHTRELIVSVLFEALDGLPDVRTPMLPGTVREFLANLERMHQFSKRFAPYEENASELEALLLGGEIQEVSAEGTGYLHFFYRPSEWEDKLGIPMANASSMVSELTPIVLYLRRVVQKNQLLIIEEPESHLHPAAQARLAVCLAKLVKTGLRVFLTTHSEWLLEQFSNLVRIGSLSAPHRANIEGLHPFASSGALNGEDVGAWVFDRGEPGTGSSVEEIPLGCGPRRMPEQYENVMMHLYDEWHDVEKHLLSKAA